MFLQSADITLKRLQEASRICGNIPRPCFEAAASPACLRYATNEIRDAIKNTEDLSNAVIKVNSGDKIHRAFQVRPSSEDRFWNTCPVEPVSDWALSEIMADLHRRTVDAAYRFYRVIRVPSSSVLCERMLETYLHPFLQTPQTFTIESLDNRSTTLEIHLTSNINTFRDMKYFSSHLASSVKSNKSCYLQPLSPVFPSFNSFLYQAGISQSGFSPVIALQVTTAAKHAINIKGLENVQNLLKSQVPELKTLRPIKARKMIILFVVPDTLGATFAKQEITGKDPEELKHWYDKTAQYVLTLSERRVFQATR